MENRVRTHPYCPDQVIGVFYVSRTLNNYVLTVFEGALGGVLLLIFLGIYTICKFLELVCFVIKKTFRN